MDRKNKKKPDFKIWRFFSISSFIGILITALMLTSLYREAAISAIVEFGETCNIAVAQTALNSVKAETLEYLQGVAGITEADTERHVIPLELKRAIQLTMLDTTVVRIKIYNQHGIIIFSTKPSQTGRDNRNNPGFIAAIDGEIKSKLVYKDTFNIFHQKTDDDNLIQTYIPIAAGPFEPPIGVFEIYTNVNPFVSKIERGAIITIAGVLFILTLLYTFLMLVIRRSGQIIEHQQNTILERTNTLEFLSSRMLTAEETEKKKITEKLHEGIAQTMSAVKMNIENVTHDLESNHPEVNCDSLHSVVSGIQDAIQEVRAMAMELHPPSLDDIGLLGTISWLCREIESVYPDIETETDIMIEEEQIPKPLKTIIFRVIQEIFGYIGKMAQADNIQLGLRVSDDQIILSIEDNGTAYYPVAGSPDGSALVDNHLAPIRERTVLSGGLFSLRSNQKGGSIYRATWDI